ncbi:hypothetical protein CISIN_1g009383mg [Citrus sinensis]|uniref:Transmembrane protein n=1 Tax=Citrus sinensis TaxID=2711 RepID=A0A067EZM7_CITSI|nr:hypothetical protein CISIN_1g009383mg [Citrus sinensis]
MSLYFRSNPPLFLPFLVIFLSLFLFTRQTSASPPHSHFHTVVPIPEREYGGVSLWKLKRYLAEEPTDNSTLILAEKRTQRKDPIDNFHKYKGGWNISNKHYWASVGFTAAPFFIIAGIWFVVFGLSLCFMCLHYCCCRREPYGYSRTCYALSLILLVFFTISAIVGCIVLYTGQGKFHSSTLDTLNYVVKQAHITSESLQNVSDYLAAAKTIGVNSVTLAPDVQSNIDKIDRKINSSATTLSYQTKKNSKDIKDALDSVGLALIIVAAVMLFLAFLGFLFSVFGLQCLVYFLVILGWILVAGTFILCGIFLLLHNVVADTCVSMDEWVKNPTAHTALDDILPCVDNATAQETLKQTKTVTNQLVSVVDRIIINVVNRNFLPQAGIVYYNQSGPLLPVLCNPFNSDLTNRQCVASEVDFSNATEVWKNYICQPSSSGICKTPGRLTPTLHNQMASAVNVSYALYRYGPFLVNLQDCTFVRDTFTDISRDHCPGLQRHSKWIYIGLFMVSAAVMLSLIFWVIYARERRHRVYTKNLMD